MLKATSWLIYFLVRVSVHIAQEAGWVRLDWSGEEKVLSMKEFRIPNRPESSESLYRGQSCIALQLFWHLLPHLRSVVNLESPTVATVRMKRRHYRLSPNYFQVVTFLASLQKILRPLFFR